MSKRKPDNPAADPNYEGNSAKYHTGKPCITKGCGKPAGTTWSPMWCQACNAERLDRVSRGFDSALRGARSRNALISALKSVRLHKPVEAPYLPAEDEPERS